MGKIDKNKYASVLERELKKIENKDISSVYQRIHELTQALHTATAKAVPSKITKLKGPNWKASLKVKYFANVKKNISYGWEVGNWITSYEKTI